LSVFLTPTGFQQKTLVDIRTEIEADYRSVFGANVDLSPEGPLGQIVALNAKMVADLWEGAQELYTSRDPNQATGEALDNICAETGVERLAPTNARCDGTILWSQMTVASTVPAGSKAKSSVAPATYSLESDVTGVAPATGPFAAVKLRLSSPFVDGDTVELIVNGQIAQLQYVEGTHGTIANFLGVYFVSIVESTILDSGAAYEYVGGQHYVKVVFGSVSTITSTISLDLNANSQQGHYGAFVADDAGARAVPANTLDTISTPVTGWLAVEQPAAGTDGTDTETDTALRLRRIKSMRSGTATEDAIRDAVYRVPGVSLAKVASNRTMSVDSESRPAKSFEVVAVGGTDTAVAQAIWNTAPAGIEIYGNFATSPVDLRPVAIGKDGLQKRVNFSRPVAKFAWVEVTVDAYNTEETTPTDLESAIKAAIVSWGAANMGLGDNMILQKFYGPIYASVPGIQYATIRIALTAAADDTPSYSTPQFLAVAAREYASFALGQVEVVL
jgi:uncharacterized phage protein gp47/JayE